jgi:RNA polymerase sigma factor (sigma-70 family)
VIPAHGGPFEVKRAAMSRILIIDDDPYIAASVSALLDAHDLRAETVSDAASAEHLLASEFFPVVLADARLRTEDEGFRLLESIRRISPASRVASMTGHATPGLEARLRELGARLVLHKPVDETLLVSALREMLDEVARAGTTLADDELGAVYESTRDTMRAIARRYRFNYEECDELTHEAWCLFLEKRRNIRAPRPWLLGTLANLCKQEIERRVRERECPLDLPTTVHPAFDTRLAVSQALSKLDVRSRTLCELIGLEQHSYDEVTAALGLPLGSVGPLYIRAKKRLRAAFA